MRKQEDFGTQFPGNRYGITSIADLFDRSLAGSDHFPVNNLNSGELGVKLEKEGFFDNQRIDLGFNAPHHVDQENASVEGRVFETSDFSLSKSQKTKLDILEAAARCYANLDSEKVTFQAIADEATSWRSS